MNNVLRRSLLVSAAALIALSLPAVAQDSPYGNGNLPGAGVNFETRLSNVEDQLRAFTGKVEQLEFALRRLDSTLQRMQADYEQRITKLETQAVQPAIVQAPPQPQVQQQPVRAPSPPSQTAHEEMVESTEAGNEPANPETSVRGSLGALRVQGERVTGAVKSPKAPPLPETPPDYGLTAQEQYDKAFSLLRQANYDEAEVAFKSFIDKNPKDKLLDNAKYWYAETFYVRSKFSEAAGAFADAYQQNPKGTKAPDSLLKLGLSLGALEKTQDACITLASLKKDYPNAPATIRARADQERSRLKCGSAPAAKKQ